MSIKSNIVQILMYELFTTAEMHLRNHTVTVINKLAQLQLGDIYHPNNIYKVYVAGQLLSTAVDMPSWYGVEVPLHAEFNGELVNINNLQNDLDHQYNIVDNYLTEILNHCECQADLFLLIPHNLHEFISPVFDASGPSTNALEYKPIADASIGYLTIKKRMLANLLIKNI